MSHRTLNNIPMIGATAIPGTNARSRRGQVAATASVTTETANALRLMFPTASGQARIVFRAPPFARTGSPTKGRLCSTMTMMPTPVMKPEITEYGV